MAKLVAALGEETKKGKAKEEEDEVGDHWADTYRAVGEILAEFELGLSDEAREKMEGLVSFRRQWEESNTRILRGLGGDEGRRGSSSGNSSSSSSSSSTRPEALPQGVVEKGSLIVAHPLLIQGLLDRSVILLAEHDYPERFHPDTQAARKWKAARRKQAAAAAAAGRTAEGEGEGEEEGDVRGGKERQESGGAGHDGNGGGGDDVVENGDEDEDQDQDEDEEGPWTRQSMGLVLNLPVPFTVGDVPHGGVPGTHAQCPYHKYFTVSN